MSAGAADEPNMTPLLDVVLQLVMFFMLCANFAMDEVNETIKLPDSIAGKALDSKVDAYVMLNVNAQGQVLIGRDNEVLDTQVKVRNYMRQQFDQDKERTARLGKAKEWEDGMGRSVIILRADKNCNFKHVYDVMQACQQVGYRNIQLRTIKHTGG